jgi:hypothetical protein
MVKPIVSYGVFFYIISMDILFNTRGNGACPLCKRNKNCAIQKSIRKEMGKVQIRKVTNDHPLEAVIYACPAFEED